MKNKIILVLLAIMCLFTVASCTKNEKEEIYKITYNVDGGKIVGTDYVQEYTKGKGVSELPTATKARNTFVGWYLNDQLITSISTEQSGDIELVAAWKAYEYKTPVTDSIKLDVDYANKDYFDDGIGTATVSQYVDGDTTIFRTKNGHKLTIRYNGVDTPESTYTVEPWGFSASKLTKNALQNATTIVLQTENGLPGKDPSNVDSTGKRYLAWVWADGRLINIELVEVGLANSKAADTKYAADFIEAARNVRLAKMRIYGEKDPDYDYSNGETLSLEFINNKYTTADAINNELDKGKKVIVSGTIVRKVGITSAYLQQRYIDETTGVEKCYGIYLYGGYIANNKLEVGYSVIVSGYLGYYNGSIQITDVSSATVRVQSTSDMDKVYIEEVDDVYAYVQDTKHLGQVIKLVNTPLLIKDYYNAEETNAFTLTAEYRDTNNTTKTIDLRVDQNITLLNENNVRITSGEYFKNEIISEIIVVVSYYDPSQNGVHDGHVQLMITQMKDITFQ